MKFVSFFFKGGIFFYVCSLLKNGFSISLRITFYKNYNNKFLLLPSHTRMFITKLCEVEK